MPSQINQKKVAKNTLMLYIRMGIMMMVSLYTSRVVLATLGVDDFGIYNVVGGVVVMFSFMNITLTVAIRRFLAFELGQENSGRIQVVFNASIIAVFLASIIVALGLETIGLWFIKNKLNIPPNRLDSGIYVFHLSVLSFFFNMNLIPFSSAIVSYEKMGVYAYFGIAETLLRLFLVLALPFFPGDKLRWYGLLIAFLSILIAFCNYLYCSIKVISPKNLLIFNWHDVRSIFSFSSWTILGTIFYMLATQGVNMIYNVFYGVAINAALGIAQQVANAANQFVGNFQTAFNPQLTKSYSAEGLSDTTFNFVCQTSRLSVLLILVICVPLLANISAILDLWLDVVPDYAAPFTVLFILYMAIDGASGPLSFLVYAKGELKLYQILLSLIQAVYVFLVYILCRLGVGPVHVLAMNVVTAAILYLARLVILKRIMAFPVMKFVKSVIAPLYIPFIVIFVLLFINGFYLSNGTLVSVLLKVIIIMVLVCAVCFWGYLNKNERQFVMSLVNK